MHGNPLALRCLNRDTWGGQWDDGKNLSPLDISADRLMPALHGDETLISCIYLDLCAELHFHSTFK